MPKRLRTWLPVWVTARFLYALGAVALLAACSPGFSPLLPMAFAVAIALAVATVVDALLGPPRRCVAVTRAADDHFALRAAGELRYGFENRSSRRVRAGITETPVRTLHFVQDEAIGDVPPRSRATLTRAVLPIERGADRFGALYVWYENVLGLLRRRLAMEAPADFRVFPDLSAVERYGALHVRNRLIEAGLRRMRLRGTGTEFESLREWTDGDAFSVIDWKATARRGKLMVARHEVERSQNVMLVLDCGRLMTARIDGKLRKFDYAVTAALSLASVAGLASDRVGVVAFAHDILAASAPRSTRSSVARLTDLLYDLEPRFEEANYTRAFAYLRTHLHKRSLIVFLTDVVDPLAQAALLAELGSLARRHLLLCVFMNDAAVNAALAGEPHDVLAAYRAGVALGLADERRTAAAILTRTGAIVLDVAAPKLTTAVIDEYLRVKQRGLL
ncbi:MAG: DUF58 domain-containing protein [Candidatus Eremiobacteraeota bacterium]|nr:DUF58 domain-containing protein [Candidatus Eremiobacteraeota bacterium]MBV8372795.1 DUF58 domain-containing protein [Candidatus Eremiobacteraeota bacterium]